MRKKAVFVLAAVLCLGICFVLPAAVYVNASELQVILDGRLLEFDTAPKIIDNRAMVPMRAVFEAFGAYVEWDAQTQRVTAYTAGGDIIRLEIDRDVIEINDRAETMDVAPQIIDNRILVPVRFVALATGYDISWENEARKVFIESGAVARGLFRRSQIRIPDRRLTELEVAEWTLEYENSGGPDIFELELLRLVNIERESYGLAPLEACRTLMMSARFKAQSMYDLDYFYHQSPVYGEFTAIPRQIFRYPYILMGENLAFGQRDAKEAMSDWMNSQSHRENILRESFRAMGAGLYGNRWVKHFGGIVHEPLLY